MLILLNVYTNRIMIIFSKDTLIGYFCTLMWSTLCRVCTNCSFSFVIINVSGQVVWRCKSKMACLAFKSFLTSMNSDMGYQFTLAWKLFAAQTTFMFLDSIMYSFYVPLQAFPVTKWCYAYFTLMKFQATVDYHVTI